MIESQHLLPAGGRHGRFGTIDSSTAPDGTPDCWVELFNADGTLARAAAFKTWRGADRVVQAWLKAGRTAAPMAPASAERQADFDAALARVAGKSV